MVDVADSWPSFALEDARKRVSDAKATQMNGEVDGANGSGDRDAVLEAILQHLEVVDHERRELQKETRWMGVRMQALERSITQAAEMNDAIYESLDRCFAELQNHEDRVLPRLTRLESDGSKSASQLAAMNQDILSARLENQTTSSGFDTWVAEILGVLHETKLMAAQARSSADVTADKADQMLVDMHGLEKTVGSTKGMVEQVKSLTDESTLAQQTLERRLETLASEVDDRLGAEVAALSGSLTSAVAGVAESQGATADLAHRLDEAIERARRNEGRLLASISSVADDLEGQVDRAEAVDARVGAIDQVVSQVESQIADLHTDEPRIGELVAEVSALESRVEATDMTVSSVVGDLSSVGADVAGLSDSLERTGGEVVAVSEQVQALKEAVSDSEDRVNGDMAGLSRLVATVSGDLSDSDQRTDELVAEVSALESRVEATDMTVSSVVGDLSSVGADVAGLSDSLERTGGEVGAVSEQVQALKEAVSDSEDRVNEGMAGLSRGVAMVSDSLRQSDQRVDELEADVSELSSRVEATDVQVSSVADDVLAVGTDLREMRGHVGDVAELFGENHGQVNAEVVSLSADVSTVAGEVAGVSSAVAKSNNEVQRLAAELATAKEKTQREIEELAEEIHAALELVREAQANAEKASDRAEYSAQVGDELRVDFDAEVARAAAERKVAQEENRIRLAAALQKLDAQAGRVRNSNEPLQPLVTVDEVDAELSEKDRYRLRWEEHLQVQAELRRQRADRQ